MQVIKRRHLIALLTNDYHYESETKTNNLNILDLDLSEKQQCERHKLKFTNNKLIAYLLMRF